MNPRFITKDIHALLDYPVALVLMAAPFILGLGEPSPFALWLGVGAGIAALSLTILTDHKLGIVRVLPYPVHVGVDALVGITFLVMPFVLGFQGLDAWFYWLNGAAVMVVVGLNAPEPQAALA
ncbi:MAG: hypothetical protein AAF432_09620 [Planctomycetota bacterium]